MAGRPRRGPPPSPPSMSTTALVTRCCAVHRGGPVGRRGDEVVVDSVVLLVDVIGQTHVTTLVKRSFALSGNMSTHLRAPVPLAALRHGRRDRDQGHRDQGHRDQGLHLRGGGGAQHARGLLDGGRRQGAPRKLQPPREGGHRSRASALPVPSARAHPARACHIPQLGPARGAAAQPTRVQPRRLQQRSKSALRVRGPQGRPGARMPLAGACPAVTPPCVLA